MLAFELARWLQQQPEQTVRHVIVSGARAPHLPLGLPAIQDLTDAELLTSLRRAGDLHPEVLAHRELRDLLLAVLRADLRLAEQYRPAPEPLLRCPLTVLGGSADPLTSAVSLEAWRRWTTGCFERHLIPAGHSLLSSGRLHVVAAVNAIVGAA
jgi:medium-chain acyl-[acyl-carrier-protein] hydrolase